MQMLYVAFCFGGKDQKMRMRKGLLEGIRIIWQYFNNQGKIRR